jgi:carboxylesterase
MLAATVALHLPHLAAGLTMLSPSFAYDGWAVSRWRYLRGLGYFLRLGRYIKLSERDPYGIKNPRLRALVAREMRERASSAAGPARLPLWGLEQAERLTRYVRARLGEFDRRLLVMHAREDEISTLDSVRRVLDSLDCPGDSLVVLENSYHMITIDNDRHRVVEELARFVAQAGEADVHRSGFGAFAPVSVPLHPYR